MAEKMVNYTPEQTAEMVKAYNAGVSVEILAQNMGKTVRSIVAKLSREGVYKRKEYVTKTGIKPVKKDIQADQIGAILGLSDGEIDSLAKANKSVLAKILAHIRGELPPPPAVIQI